MSRLCVPETYYGLWRRTLLETADGQIDTTSRVFWLQTESFHLDIRIPDDRFIHPLISDLGDLSLQNSLDLARQAGFAGRTSVEGNRCQWLREIDYQPPSDSADIGIMTFKNMDEILEEGVDGSYRELWRRVPKSAGLVSALRWEEKRGSGANRVCYQAITGDFCMLARGRTTPLPKNSKLPYLVKHATPVERIALLDMEISLLQRIVGQWFVVLSTLPWNEGRRYQLHGA